MSTSQRRLHMNAKMDRTPIDRRIRPARGRTLYSCRPPPPQLRRRRTPSAVRTSWAKAVGPPQGGYAAHDHQKQRDVTGAARLEATSRSSSPIGEASASRLFAERSARESSNPRRRRATPTWRRRSIRSCKTTRAALAANAMFGPRSHAIWLRRRPGACQRWVSQFHPAAAAASAGEGRRARALAARCANRRLKKGD